MALAVLRVHEGEGSRESKQPAQLIEELGCFEGCSVNSSGFVSSVCVGRLCSIKQLTLLGPAPYPMA